MLISPFFRNLRSAYQAEIDDLMFDSDGRDVLRQRLAEKRREIGFLVQMMALSPEMVAVIFHQGLRFTEPALMAHLLSHEADELPDWSGLCGGIEMTPWAHDLAQIILKEPGGEWFMTLTAGLHYMASRPELASASQGADDAGDSDEADEADEGGGDYRDEFDDHEDDEVRGDARSRAEAGADWLEGQGFDRKD